MAAVDDVIITVRHLIQDTKQPYRYDDIILRRFIEQTLKRMMFIRPDIFSVTAKIPAESGSVVQKLPSNAFRLVDVLAVCDAPCDEYGSGGELT